MNGDFSVAQYGGNIMDAMRLNLTPVHFDFSLPLIFFGDRVPLFFDFALVMKYVATYLIAHRNTLDL